jgi:GPH family glycoside/pentoside/hexuronide:cation symporter
MNQNMLREINRIDGNFKFFWSLASLGSSLLSGIFAAMLPMFFQDYLGLASSYISLAALIYAIWNALNDPLFGFISDSSKSPMGRRIPFMRYTAPFLSLTFIIVWLVPVDSPQPTIFWWMLITMLLYDTCFTIVGIVYSALLPEISQDDRVRGELQKASSLTFLIGTILGFLIPDFFRPKAGGSLTSFYVAMIVVGIICSILIMITTFHVNEHPEFTKVDQPLPMLLAIKYTFKSKSFIIVTVQNFMSIFTQSILTGTMFYLADYVLQVASIIPLIFVFLGLLIGVLFANILANKIGVVQAQQVLLFVSGLGLIFLSFSPAVLIYVCLLFAGIGLSGPLVLTNILFGQIADEDELVSGVRREAMFFGTNALITKPAQSIAIALVPFLLELSGFITRSQSGGEITLDQPPAALLAIRLSLGLIPGLALIAGALLLFLYPIRGKYLIEMKEKLNALHIDKQRRLETGQ